MSLLFVFLDGVGLGPAGPDNPLAASWPGLEAVAGGRPWTAEAMPVVSPTQLFLPLDATLGMPGLPQSGTGQASLFTGTNCAERAGRHFGPYPHSTSKPVIARRNIFHAAREASGGDVAFANAYPERFFTYAESRNRWTVTTRCCIEAQVRIRGPEWLARGEALAADLTGEGWQRIGYSYPPISPEEAARRLSRLAHRHAFTLFEFYLTDKAGHSQDPERAAAVLSLLDLFFATLLDTLGATTLLVTSDHGNIEDLSIKTHTRNSVPLAVYGPMAPAFARTRALTDVVPAVEQALQR